MLGMVTTENAINTGVKEIAEALGGGIREGSLVFIEGEAKSGKSVLSQYIAWGVLCSRESSVACYTTDGSAEALINQMDSLALYARKDFVTDRFRVYPMASSYFQGKAESSLQFLANHIPGLPERFKLVIVDSITPFMTLAKPVIKLDFLQECKELCERGRSIVLVVGTQAIEEKLLARAYEMSDYYLNLRSKDVMIGTGQMDSRVVKILKVTKLAGAERRTQASISFEIKPGVGIQILPFLRVRV